MKRFIVSFLVFLVIALGLAACSKTTTTEEYLEYARAFREQGDLNAALTELNYALKQSPDDAKVRQEIGSIYFDSEKYESAEEEFLRAVDLGLDYKLVVIPVANARLEQAKFSDILDDTFDERTLAEDQQVELWVIRGHAQMGMKKLDFADEMYDVAISLQSNNAEALLGKARVAAAKDLMPEARTWLEKVFENSKHHSPAWSFLGDIEQFQQNFEAAEIAYTRALEDRPESVYDLANRALVRISQKELGAAATDLQSARRIDAKNSSRLPLVMYVQGQLSLANKNYAAAVAAFEKMVIATPDYVPARYYLAFSQYRLGHFEQALQNVNIFRSASPEFASGHRLFAAIKFSQGQYDAAEAELENLVSFDPSDSWALNLLADIAILKGNPEQSIENYRKLVALNPDSATAQMHLGLSLMVQGSDEEASEAFAGALELDEGALQVKMLIIVNHLRARQWDAAIELGEKMIAQDPGNWDAFTLLGGAYIGKGDTETARQMFVQALELSPGNPNAANNLARLELQEGNAAEARRLYEMILRYDPDQTSAMLSLSKIDLNEGKFPQAIARLEDGLERAPKELELRLSLARLYLRTGKPSRNLSLIHAADEQQANHPLMLQVLGDSQSALGDFDSATETYKKVVSLVPESATAHYLLARAYAARNQMGRAEQQLQKVIELEPDHYNASVLRIRFLRLQNKEQEALKLLEAVDRADLEKPDMLVERGWLALYQNQNAEAVTAFERAFDLVPNSDVVIQLGIARWQSGNEEAALDGYKQWLRYNPQDIQVRFHLANGYLQLGRDKEALVAFRELLDKTPQDPRVLNNIAWLTRDSDPKRALELAQRTTVIAPNWAPGLDTLGFILMDQGELDKAYRNFELALKQAPQDPDIRYHLALASSRMNEIEQARRILQAILADPAAQFASRKDAEELLRSL